jgi:hypothetical protein
MKFFGFGELGEKNGKTVGESGEINDNTCV